MLWIFPLIALSVLDYVDASLDLTKDQSTCNLTNYDQEVLKKRFDTPVASFFIDSINQSEWMSRFDPFINKIQVKDMMIDGPINNFKYPAVLDVFVNDSAIFLITSAYLEIPHDKFSIRLENSSFTPNSVVDSGNYRWRIADRNKPVVLIYSSHHLKEILTQHRNIGRTRIRIKIVIELNGVKHSKKFALSLKSLWPNNGEPNQFVTVTLIGPDISISELITHINYYRMIGFQHFFLYFLIPLNCLPDSEVKELNTLARTTNYSFSIIQWHPFSIDDPAHKNPKEPHVGCTHLYFLASILYRLKNNLVDTWIAHVDIDDYIIPPANLNILIKERKRNCIAIGFHTSHFYMVNPGQNHTNPVNILPHNFSLSQLMKSTIVREHNLALHSYRPKLIFRSSEALDVGNHWIRQPGRDNWCSSKYFYLHPAVKNTRNDRDFSMIKELELTSMDVLLYQFRNATKLATPMTSRR